MKNRQKFACHFKGRCFWCVYWKENQRNIRCSAATMIQQPVLGKCTVVEHSGAKSSSSSSSSSSRYESEKGPCNCTLFTAQTGNEDVCTCEHTKNCHELLGMIIGPNFYAVTTPAPAPAPAPASVIATPSTTTR